MKKKNGTGHSTKQLYSALFFINCVHFIDYSPINHIEKRDWKRKILMIWGDFNDRKDNGECMEENESSR